MFQLNFFAPYNRTERQRGRRGKVSKHVDRLYAVVGKTVIMVTSGSLGKQTTTGWLTRSSIDTTGRPLPRQSATTGRLPCSALQE